MALAPDGTAFDLTGPDGAPAVVLIHGLGLTRQTTWAGIVPHLADRYRVLSYDLCGHGQSALPRETPGLGMLARQLTGLMDHLRIDRAALVGFSLGGMINRRCAMDHPGRVSGLVILNSPHERGPEAQQGVEAAARASAAEGPGAVIDAALARWFTEAFHRDRPDVIARIRATVLANDPAAYAAHRLVLAEGVRELIRPDPPVPGPALVMTCENDTGSTPAMSHAIAAEIDGATCRIVPRLRHLGLLEDPAAFAGPVRAFLDRVRG